ncbi:hypothetical protein QR680_014254 [Steinernema hermaphroditum]|uniref:G-protein coupled receptors family 1 profile domain-containing protein n=1 Tax=Steinernema hermaphroditum TaxID=289476 RepID=A0AA39M3L4_9BILA|nr:hypothetical protein QR680_014254 [Steinernema hermaphroditum]
MQGLLYLTSGSIFFIGAFGLFGNANLIIATLRTLPALKRSRCGLLIGMIAVCDLICIIFEWQNATRLLLGVQNYRESCFWAMSPYLFVMNFQAVQMPTIALDRVFAMCAPIKYRRLDFSIYIALCMIPGTVFTSTLFVMAIINMNNEPIEACNPPLAYPPVVTDRWSRWVIVVDTTTIVVYVLAVAVLYIRKRSMIKSDSEYFNQQAKVMRTVVVIAIAFASTWFVSHWGVLLATMVGLSDGPMHLVQTLAVIPAMVCYAQNYYIYLWRSKEYRDLFAQQFKTLVRFDLSYCKSTKVHVMSMSNASVASVRRSKMSNK